MVWDNYTTRILRWVTESSQGGYRGGPTEWRLIKENSVDAATAAIAASNYLAKQQWVKYEDGLDFFYPKIEGTSILVWIRTTFDNRTTGYILVKFNVQELTFHKIIMFSNSGLMLLREKDFAEYSTETPLQPETRIDNTLFYILKNKLYQ